LGEGVSAPFARGNLYLVILAAQISNLRHKTQPLFLRVLIC